MADAAVRAHDALLMGEFAAGFERRADAAFHFGAVVGMHRGDEIVDRAAERLPRQPVNVEQLVRPGNSVGHDVPRPASQIGQALGVAHMDIGVGKLGGTLPDPAVEFGLGAPQALLARPADRNVGA